MGNCDVEKEDSDVVEWAIHTLSESNDEDEVNHAMQVLVNHGYVNLDGDTIELNPNKDGVKTELLIKQDVVNLIDELNAVSFYEANEHSRECYYDIRNAVIAMQLVASCSDAISRQGLLDTIDRFCDLGKRQLKEIVRDLPSVTPKQRTGHWIFEEGDGKTCFDGYVCSACNKSFHTHVPYFAEYEFCPHCGADMRESEE